jgi:enediyne biosynthesis protein E4
VLLAYTRLTCAACPKGIASLVLALFLDHLNTAINTSRFTVLSGRRMFRRCASSMIKISNHGSVLVSAVLFILVAALVTAARGAGAFTATPTDEPIANFVDITARSGIDFRYQSSHTSRKYLLETMGSGVALFDFDNDGRLDIFLVNGAHLDDPTPRGSVPQKSGPAFWNRLYHQKSDGTFEDVTEKAGLQGAGYGFGVAVGDYDNDGYEDLYVTAYGSNKLYHNNGNGTFSDVTQSAGVSAGGWSSSAAWVDLDGDGFLDLVVLRYLEWDFEDLWCGLHQEGHRSYCHPDLFKPVAPIVYHNNHDGTFSEITEKIGMSKPGKGLGLSIADYDRDGRIDLFVANDSVPEFLYHSIGNGTFEEVADRAGTAVDADGHVYAGMGVDFTDYNNDGWADLMVTDLGNQGYALYKNNGDGSFSYASTDVGIRQLSLLHSGWGMRFFDFDNDGWKDLFVAQGHVNDLIEQTHPDLHYREPMLLARNTGHGFVDISRGSGPIFGQPFVARGMALGDIDNDGRLDVLVSTNEGPVFLLHNETTTGNHWLLLKLVGRKSNRDAIGAEVKVITADRQQMATVTTTGSYLSSSDKRVHFGLGKENIVDQIEIRWPSGIRQTLKHVLADQILTIDEPGS